MSKQKRPEKQDNKQKAYRQQILEEVGRKKFKTPNEKSGKIEQNMRKIKEILTIIERALQKMTITIRKFREPHDVALLSSFFGFVELRQ